MQCNNKAPHTRKGRILFILIPIKVNVKDIKQIFGSQGQGLKKELIATYEETFLNSITATDIQQ